MTASLATLFDPWSWAQAYQQTWLASLDPMGTGRTMRQQRLKALLAGALRDSPLYARRAKHARELADVEPIGKQELMHHFDDWATDRRITRSAADAVVASASGVADLWLDRYLVWTSSGTSGHPGLFVQDAVALASLHAGHAQGLQLDELWLGGEQLTPKQRHMLQETYRCKVRNSYGASEFYSIAFECAHGRLHLNDDWVILEGIDASGCAVPIGGVLSHHAADESGEPRAAAAALPVDGPHPVHPRALRLRLPGGLQEMRFDTGVRFTSCATSGAKQHQPEGSRHPRSDARAWA